jgi:serine protease Do
MTRRRLLLAILVFTVASVRLPAEEKKNDGFELVIPGQILTVDPPDKARNLPCKIHVVRFKKDKAYLIDMVSTEFDSYLRLEDTAGNRLAEDDDSGGNLNARIRFTAPRDDLFLVIATTCGGGAGNYTLSIRSYVPAPVKLIELAAPAANKATEFQGPLAPQDPLDKSRNVPSRIHTVDLKADKTYVFDLISSDFDAYLRLEGPDGANLAEDDDGGGNLNSRITHQVRTAGRYRLVAMPLSGVRGGQYTLRVTER